MEVLLLVGLAIFLGAMVSSSISQTQRNRQKRKRDEERRRERQRVISESAELLAAERIRLRGTGKVPVVDWDEAFLESHSIRFRRPSVPRSRPSGWTPEWDAQQLLRQEGFCYWCGESLNGVAHRDHVEPLARGGCNDISNLVMACPPCNLDKGASDPRKWIWTTPRIQDQRRAVLDSLLPQIDLGERVAEATASNHEDDESEPVEFDLLDLRLFDP